MGLFDNGGLLGGASAVADDIGAPATQENDESYPAHYDVDRFDSFGNDSLSQGKAVEIARDEIPAGIARRWGFGSAKHEANQGYAYAVLQNADGEQIHGRLVFVWENATGRETQVVHELDSQDMDTADRYDRDTQPPMPEQTDKNRAERDQSLVLLFEARTDPSTITNNYGIAAGQSECRLPATEYDLS